jgi:hypothetical protein
MANEKKLIIGADVQGVEKSFTKVKKMLEGLQKEGIKVSNVLKDMTIEKNHGMGKFAKSVVFSTQKMRDFRGITEDTAKVMKNVWQRTMQQEQQSLDRTTRQLERLNKLRKEQVTHLSTARQHGGTGERYQANVDRLETMIAGKVAERMSRQDGLRELQGPQRPWYSVGDGYRSAVGGLQGLAGGAANLLGVYQNYKTVPSQNMAALHGFEKNLLNRMIGGDFSDLYFMKQGFGAANGPMGLKHAMDKAGGLGAGTTQNSFSLADSGLQALSGFLQVLPGGRGGGKGGGGGGMVQTMGDVGQGAGAFSSGTAGVMTAWENGFNGGPQVAEAQSVQAQLASQRAQSPFSEAALNFLSSTAAMRVAGSKALQGHHMGAWAVGRAGFGLDMGESIAAAAQLGRMGGVHATMGTNGRPGLLGGVLGMEATGIDRGAASQMLTQMNFANGGDSGRAMKQMQEVMSKAFSVGLKDARLGEEIGKATAEASIGQGGFVTDTAAVGRALTGGLGEKSTLFDVQQNIAGGQALDARMNDNTYFNAIKMESAKKALGPEGTHTQMLALQNATWKELVGGSTTLDVAKVSETQRRAVLNDSARAGVKSYLDPTDSAGPMKDLAGVANSEDFIGALQAASKRKDGSFERIKRQYGTLMNTRMKVPEKAAEGELDLIAGFGDNTKGNGNGYSNKTDHVAAKTAEAQQAVLQELYKQEIGMRKDYLKALKAAPKFTEAIAQNDNNKSDTAFEDIMKKFIAALEEVLKRHPTARQGSTRGR